MGGVMGVGLHLVGSSYSCAVEHLSTSSRPKSEARGTPVYVE